MMRCPRRCAAALVLLLLAAASPAFGDGGYVPERAYAALPTIPMQRALIVYRDGVETLLVESTFKTDSPEVGWILPLPAEPTKFDVADPGTLTSLAVCLRSEVIHDLYYVYWPAVFVLGYMAVLLLFSAASAKGVTLTGVILWGLLYLLILALFLPALNIAGIGGGTPGVEVVSTQRVGHYDVSVVRGKDIAALGRWIEGNGLRALDEKALAIVDDYIARGWCFAVARLGREAEGEATPHPIRVTFPVEQPVYPMRLTSIAGSKTRVELYVIADRMAAADGFRLASADAYEMRPADPLIPYSGPAAFGSPVMGEAVNLRLRIGNAEAVEMMWDGCVLTRLEADLGPEGMDKDVMLRLEPLQTHRDTFFSSRGRDDVVLAVFLWGMIPVAGYAAVVCNKQRRPTRAQGRRLTILAAGVLAIALVVSIFIPTIAVGPGMRTLLLHVRYQDHLFGTVAQAMVAKGHLHSGMSDAELAQFPQRSVELGFLDKDAVPDPLINLYTGSPVRCERSPGNFAFRRIGNETWLCLYNENGVEHRVLALPPPPVVKTPTEPEGKPQ
jgi:hypothetical protein